jgi:YebC/PmpR family DNA-binding regulatory protein
MVLVNQKSMSGHSKWHNIQGRKGAQDKRKAAAFTRVARAITLAARQGGGSIDTNFALRLAVEHGREVNMPKENIDRAIRKGTGEDKDGTTLESVTYEGFGPAKVAVIVETLTDNRNRTAADVKSIFNKAGAQGSVSWQFQHVAVVRVHAENTTKIIDRDTAELALIDAGAEDVVWSEVGLTVIGPIESLHRMVEAVRVLGISPDAAAIEWRAKEYIAVSEDASKSVEDFFAALDEYDDVQEWYTNAQ